MQSLEANVENWISANTDQADKKEMKLMLITDQSSWRNWWRGTSYDSSKKCGNLFDNCYSSIENEETAPQLFKPSVNYTIEADTNADVKLVSSSEEYMKVKIRFINIYFLPLYASFKFLIFLSACNSKK